MPKANVKLKLSDRLHNFRPVFMSRAADVFIYIFLVVFPLYFNDTKYGSITGTKFSFFVTFSIIMLIFMGIIALYDVKTKFPPISQIFKNSTLPQKLIAAYALFCVISMICSIPQYGSEAFIGTGRSNGLLTQLLYCAIFMFISVYGKFGDRHIFAFGASMTIFDLVCLLQFAGFNPLSMYGAGSYYGNKTSFIGTLGNIDMVGSLVSLSLPLFVFAVVIMKNKFKYLLLIPAVTSMLIMLHTNVAASYLSVAGTLFLLLPLLLNSFKRLAEFFVSIAVLAIAAALYLSTEITYDKKLLETSFAFEFSKLSEIILIAAAVLAALSPLLLLISNKTSVKPKVFIIGFAAFQVAVLAAFISWLFNYNGPEKIFLHEISQMLGGNFDDELGNGRMYVWKRSFAMMKEEFSFKDIIFGSGPDTFNERFQEYVSDRQDYYISGSKKILWDDPHNTYLQMLCNTGVFSVTAFIGAIVASAVNGIKTLSRNAYALILMAPVLAYMIDIFFIFTLPMITPVFFILFALLDNVSTLEKKAAIRESELEALEETKQRKKQKVH